MAAGLIVKQQFLNRILVSEKFWSNVNKNKLSLVLKYRTGDLNNLFDKDGKGILYYAALHGDCVECISILEKKGVNFKAKFFGGVPILHIMIAPASPTSFNLIINHSPNIEMIKAVKKAGAGINALHDIYKTPPLFPAIHFHKGVKLIKALIELGADVDFQGFKDKRTPLIAALKPYNKIVDMEVIKLLLAYGADPTIKDTENKSALDYMALDESLNDTVLFKGLLKQIDVP